MEEPMATKSKKLQTSIGGLDALDHIRGRKGSFQDALHHDARIAHEQREVIRQLAKALTAMVTIADPMTAAHGQVVTAAQTQLAAAGPFLED
jgi:hypothetical protein